MNPKQGPSNTFLRWPRRFPRKAKSSGLEAKQHSITRSMSDSTARTTRTGMKGWTSRRNCRAVTSTKIFRLFFNLTIGEFPISSNKLDDLEYSFTLYSDSLICIISGMEEFEIRFIENEGDARIISSEIFAKLYDLSTRDDKALKDSITHFLGKVNENINTKESSSASKLMSILILRDLIESSLRP